jgi:hypothetical protein
MEASIFASASEEGFGEFGMQHKEPFKANAVLMSLLLFVACSGHAVAANKLLEMSDRLDKLEKSDFNDTIEKADSCTRKRNFKCAESELDKAGKIANSSQDKRLLLTSRESLAREKQLVEEERRRREEEERRREEEQRLAEQQQREAEAAEMARRNAEEDDGPSSTEIIMAQINKNAAEMGAIIRKTNRDTAVAFAQSNRALAEQKRERERQQKETADRRSSQTSTSYTSTSSTTSTTATASRDVNAYQPSPAVEKPQKLYTCTERKGFSGYLGGDDAADFARVCTEVQKRASDWAADVGRGDWAYGKYVVTSIDQCVKGKVYGNVNVYVNMQVKRSSPCDELPKTISK